MSYYFAQKLRSSLDDAAAKTTTALEEEGFGIITEIDVNQTLERDVDFRRYKIRGACNSETRPRGAQGGGQSGTMLPCNVIVQELVSGQVEVAAIDPVVSMQAVENPEQEKIATAVRQKLQRVIEKL